MLGSPRLALSFLTRVPAGSFAEVSDADLRDATAWFPLIGVVVAAPAALARWGLDGFLGPFGAAVVAVLVAVAVTGAFHEDGLADTFDGLWGGWTVERRIAIMRDSRIGTYGAVALLGGLLLRVAVLARVDAGDAWRVLLLGHVLGRLAILLQIRLLPAASDQGSGARVADPVALGGLAVALATAAVATAGALAGWPATQPPALVVVALLVAVGVAVGALALVTRAKLGGLTGDVLGATQQVTLITVAATASWLLVAGGTT